MTYEVELSRKGCIRLAIRLIFCAIWYGGITIIDHEFEGEWIEEET